VRAAGLSVVIALALVVLSWSIIGFAGLLDYPAQVRAYPVERTFSLIGMAGALGLDPMVGHVAMVLAGGGLLLAVMVLGRAREDAGAFACAIAATLTLTPVLQLNFLALMAVPLAVARPRFSVIWLLPIVLWVCPRDGHGDGLQPFLPAAVVLLLLSAVLARPRYGRGFAEVPA
jgi:hypothetical protein